jgi:hypothetical protein
MQHERLDLQEIELTREISFPGDIRFDPDAMTLAGSYADQLSAYRARRAWVDTLENCFLLDLEHDFFLKITSDLDEGRFNLTCSFESACARYAFWRLTNNQAPEAQYLIETAHIPSSESHQDQLMGAPDMRSAIEQSLDPKSREHKPSHKKSMLEALGSILSRLIEG